MNVAPRRQVLRPPPRPAANDDLRRQRQREELTQLRGALKHWLSRLKRTTNKVFDLQRRITRLEAQLNAS